MIKDNKLDNDGIIDLEEIRPVLNSEDKEAEIKLRATILNYFDSVEQDKGKMEEEGVEKSEVKENTKFAYSVRKMIKYCLECSFGQRKDWMVDELLVLVEEALTLFLPARIYGGVDQTDREVMISEELGKLALISDTVDYKKNQLSYNDKNLTAHSYDLQSLPSKPLER
jgi:hypothetical protein